MTKEKLIIAVDALREIGAGNLDGETLEAFAKRARLVANNALGVLARLPEDD